MYNYEFLTFIMCMFNSSPFGQAIKHLYNQIAVRQRGGHDTNPLELLIRERVLNLGGINLNGTMGDSEDDKTPPPTKSKGPKRRDVAAEVAEEDRLEREEKKKNREPPVVFRYLPQLNYHSYALAVCI